MSEAPKDPMRAAQANMRPARLKRFFKAASVGEVEGGFALLLDGRRARTPGQEAADSADPRARRTHRRGMGGAGRDDRSRRNAADAPRQFGARRRRGGDGGDPRRDRRLRGVRPVVLPPNGARSARRGGGRRIRSRARLGGGSARREVPASPRAWCMSASPSRRAASGPRRARGLRETRSRWPRCTS